MTGCQRLRFDLIALRRHRIRRKQPAGSSPSIPSTCSATASTSCALAPRRKTRRRRRFSMRCERFDAVSSRSASRRGSRRSPRTSVTPSGAPWIVEVRSHPRWISTRLRSRETGDDEEELLLGFREALASMPERQRRALVLREWQGVPSREIASELGLSATATHALLTRARHSFAQALTLPGRPVAGLAWLAFELRSHLKALLGGVSTKAAVTSVAVIAVGLGAGGVVVDRSLADSKAPPAPVQGNDPSPIESSATAPTAESAHIPFGRRVARASRLESILPRCAVPSRPRGRAPSRRPVAACGTTGDDSSRAGGGRSPSGSGTDQARSRHASRAPDRPAAAPRGRASSAAARLRSQCPRCRSPSSRRFRRCRCRAKLHRFRHVPLP